MRYDNEEEIIICFINDHSSKALSFIFLTEEGIEIPINDLHQQKLYSSISVTEEGAFVIFHHYFVNNLLIWLLKNNKKIRRNYTFIINFHFSKMINR